MTDYSKITALYSRLSVGDEDRDGGESNSIQNQKIFLENYARGQHLTNIRHYIQNMPPSGLRSQRNSLLPPIGASWTHTMPLSAISRCIWREPSTAPRN